MAALVGRSGSGAPSLVAAVLALARGSYVAAARQPLLLLLVLRIVQELCNVWVRRRMLSFGRLRVRGLAEEIDSELIQGCLLSTENLLSLGRVEKRTIFTRPLLEVLAGTGTLSRSWSEELKSAADGHIRASTLLESWIVGIQEAAGTRPLLEVLGGNRYLVQELVRGAQECRRRSHNCMVARWLPPDERYHALQACLNEVSSLFGTNFVHFNALDGDTHGLFKSTWYCLTLATPTRPDIKRHEPMPPLTARGSLSGGRPNDTCTFTDMSRQPRPTLRVLLINESEIRRIADGKLRAPSFGFFNTRHAERYRMLVDFARNFQKQLVRASVDSGASNSRSPFTSEKVSQAQPSQSQHLQRPDGGMMKRVHSQPSMMNHVRTGSHQHNLSSGGSTNSLKTAGNAADGSPFSPTLEGDRTTKADGGAEECCFLRLHVPHFVGRSAHSEMQPQVVVVGADGNAGMSNQAAAAVGLRHVRSANNLGVLEKRTLGPSVSSQDSGFTRMAS
eukprot:CAMPEP_0204097230 /NCGR_PEP_ID=MMETSP0360-20130528/192340_1 /ASSEMBLY_ACC=CAM_ASM_000342 /TAXON_ID=268821 /ORGANISM="Scrippsiella Hangoei, Strain SHTV-5" /LENGTH=503 /DNA_ID=CAMNT_0051046577 /DNA_START=36 /DNA_END=1548 /DNA_ORIENTATION=-